MRLLSIEYDRMNQTSSKRKKIHRISIIHTFFKNHINKMSPKSFQGHFYPGQTYQPNLAYVQIFGHQLSRDTKSSVCVLLVYFLQCDARHQQR